jgi:hypothetical protein
MRSLRGFSRVSTFCRAAEGQEKAVPRGWRRCAPFVAWRTATLAEMTPKAVEDIDRLTGTTSAPAGCTCRADEIRHEPTSDGVFLTGATGFVGMELLARYLERTDRRIFALVRGSGDQDAAARVEGTLRSLFGPEHRYAERVVAVPGDITHQDLGLHGERDSLAERIGEIVHGAASVSFELGLEASRAINVEGTRRVLDFAGRCQAHGGLRRLSYISTARGCAERSRRPPDNRRVTQAQGSQTSARRLSPRGRPNNRCAVPNRASRVLCDC